LKVINKFLHKRKENNGKPIHATQGGLYRSSFIKAKCIDSASKYFWSSKVNEFFVSKKTHGNGEWVIKGFYQ
jgi:hypothetical protein